MTSLKTALLGASALISLASGALAQTVPLPPSSAAVQASSEALPTVKGQVQQFTLTGRGDIDGLILTDGTEVKTPPHLSAQIAYAMKPGNAVTVRGLKALSLPVIQAASITDDASGVTIVDQGSRGLGAPPPRPPRGGPPATWDMGNLDEVQGRIKVALHGPQGEVNGALLEDGTTLRLPPHEAYRYAGLLQSGQPIVAQGELMSSALGRVLEVRRLGPSREQLGMVDEPRRGRRGPRG